ncbi:unnamed protein product [Psylliodes chrysocephalus]|uniref:Uncharacterized protein n=1 Tax=Psylliodes chrysocephalus TaxID=3402493 RepID=A0A9P0CQF9_9CUCU|nr:unnamed protein product [Psylliodes chrysocephala]
MGSRQSLQKRKDDSVLNGNIYKDVQIPGDVSRVISKFILALSDGYFYPCMIMRPTTDGYVVYFFYLKEEREIPSNVIIGNLWYLINCEVSFTDINGNIATGRIVGTDFKSTDTDREQPMNFFIYCNDACRTISFPYIFLSTQQARMLCG